MIDPVLLEHPGELTGTQEKTVVSCLNRSAAILTAHGGRKRRYA